jgi:hypothetical protein
LVNKIKMNIGVLIICTGKYNIFFEKLYESSEKYFLKNHNKTYYVFTDNEIIEKNNIVKIHQNNLGWPDNTLKRFEMFSRVSEILHKEDYLYFLNANMLFLDYVDEEVIPSENQGFLMGVNHPGFFNKPVQSFTYERRKESVFFIAPNEGLYYYQGCFNGGRSDKFLEMSKELEKMINLDLKNNIVPIWHDESALNWYYLKKNPLIVDCSYAYPEGWEIPFSKKILQRNKQNYGGYEYLRNK